MASSPRPGVVERYLTRYAEPESSLAAAVSRYGHVLSVPVYDEGDSFFRLLDSVTAGPLGATLTIAVVNARDDSEPGVIERNRTLLSRVAECFPLAKQLGEGAVLYETAFGQLLCLDRSSRARLPKRRGVGLARKIAADLALAIGTADKLASRWIHFSDADAVLPADYFARLGSPRADAPAPDVVAAVYPFRHDSPNAELKRAGALYEMFMRHYVVGLESAGSRYAYHSIGSSIAVDAAAYATVRGIPSRHGAEDFYLLNKLAKLGGVARLGGAPIALEARASHRVPFGTGPAIRRLIAPDAATRTFYSPTSFVYLGALHDALQAALDVGPDADAGALLLEHGVARGLDASLLRELADFVDLGAQFRASAARSTRRATRERDIHSQFDALRTLQLLHWLRDRALPLCDWREALAPLGISPDQRPEEARDELITYELSHCRGITGWQAAATAPSPLAPPID